MSLPSSDDEIPNASKSGVLFRVYLHDVGKASGLNGLAKIFAAQIGIPFEQEIIKPTGFFSRQADDDMDMGRIS